jgi:uncharacterized protein (DUF3820 family)
MSEERLPNPAVLEKWITATLPGGKYVGKKRVDLPEPYVDWFRQKGFPKGKLGQLLEAVYPIKAYGLEYLFRPGMKNPEKRG